ncbi:MAG: DUF4160 domain-containing protein [Alphaproteobacteria bacterium]|nr:DUF4160 domain-containing protein [Alphaproteobacteria bacterium]
MPTIAVFYGITIRMYFNDHDPAHFHARYGRSNVIVRISDGQIIRGELPPVATRIVTEWALSRRVELVENWRRARAQEQLERIAGPDGAG